MVAGGVDDKLQTVIFFFQIHQLQNFRLIVGAVHIVDMEFSEIADDDPAGLFGLGKIAAIPPGLLIGRKQGAIGLPVTFPQVNIHPLLLDQHSRLRDVTVNEFCRTFSGFGIIDFDAPLEADGFFWFLYAKNFLQQCQPKSLCFLLLIAVFLPIQGKLFGCRSLFCVVHNFLPVTIFCSGS